MSDTTRLQNLKKAYSMSFDMGLLENNTEVAEERSRMTAKLLRGKMLAMQSPTPRAPPESSEKEVDEKESKYEPDWSSFEDQYAKDLLPSPGGMEKTTKFLGEVVDILLDYVKKSNDRSVKVLDFNHPNVLQETLGHCLEIPKTPRDLEQILSDCKETLKFGVKTAHPRFFNQLSSGLDMIALAGEWLCATANANMFTYEIAPVFTLMEEVTLQKMREYVGWLDGDGIFAPGGAISNLYAINAARHKFFPECKHKGMASIPHIVVYTGEQSHYSIKQAGAVLGLGADNVVAIKCDERGKMMVDELEKHIIEDQRQGKRPYMVSATAGTTVMGAFDRLNAIADLCEKYGLWMHVDAAWGGGALLSRKRRHLLDGVHRADSVTWNPHKMMGTILQCSAVLLKEKDLLASCNSMHADYLFQRDKHYDTSFDTGDKAIQCGRRNDVFKLWLMWRAKGDMGFEAQIEKVFHMSEHLQDQIRAREGFEFVMDKPEYTNVCFFYIPTFLRSHERGFRFDVKVNQVAPKVKAMMMEKGTTMVGYQPLGKIPNFFRMVISNPAVETSDIDFLLDEIQRLGEEIEPGDVQSPHK